MRLDSSWDFPTQNSQCFILSYYYFFFIASVYSLYIIYSFDIMLWKLEERNRKHVFSIFFLFYILAAIFSSYLILNDIFSFLFSLFVGIFFCSSEKDFQKNKSLLFYHYVKVCIHTMYSIHRKESYHLGVKFLENINSFSIYYLSS